MVNFLYFGILNELLQGIINALQAVLEGLFGTSVAPLFENFFGNAFTFFLDLIWSKLAETINVFLYDSFVWSLAFLDMLAYVFDIFIGMQTITVNTATGEKDTLFNLMFYSGGVSTAFWGITVIAFFLCVFFSIVAVLRSMMDLDVKRPVGKVMGLMGRSMLNFLLVPFVCMAGLNLSTVVLTSSAQAISGQTTSHKVSIGTQIYTAVAQNGMRQHAVQPEEQAIEGVFNIINKGLMMVLNPAGVAINLIIDAVVKTVNTIGYFVPGEPGVFDDASLGMVRLEDEVKRAGFTLNSAGGNAKMRELITQLFNNGGIYDERNNAAFACTIADLTERLGFGRMPYLDKAYVAQYIKPNLVNSFIGGVCSLCVLVFMLMGAFIFARRIFEILLLYITAPFFASSIPLDDGHKFKAWREQFIGKVLAGYGIVFSMRIFLLMVPVIFSNRIRFTVLPITDTVIRMVLLVAAAASVLKAHTLIAKIIGGESSAESEAGALGGRMFSMAMSPVTYAYSAATGAVSKMANTAMSNISQSAMTSLTSGGQRLSASIQNLRTGGSGGGTLTGGARGRAAGKITGAAGRATGDRPVFAPPSGAAGKRPAVPGKPLPAVPGGKRPAVPRKPLPAVPGGKRPAVPRKPLPAVPGGKRPMAPGKPLPTVPGGGRREDAKLFTGDEIRNIQGGAEQREESARFTADDIREMPGGTEQREESARFTADDIREMPGGTEQREESAQFTADDIREMPGGAEQREESAQFTADDIREMPGGTEQREESAQFTAGDISAASQDTYRPQFSPVQSAGTYQSGTSQSQSVSQGSTYTGGTSQGQSVSQGSTYTGGTSQGQSVSQGSTYTSGTSQSQSVSQGSTYTGGTSQSQPVSQGPTYTGGTSQSRPVSQSVSQDSTYASGGGARRVQTASYSDAAPVYSYNYEDGGAPKRKAPSYNDAIPLNATRTTVYTSPGSGSYPRRVPAARNSYVSQTVQSVTQGARTVTQSSRNVTNTQNVTQGAPKAYNPASYNRSIPNEARRTSIYVNPPRPNAGDEVLRLNTHFERRKQIKVNVKKSKDPNAAPAEQKTS